MACRALPLFKYVTCIPEFCLLLHLFMALQTEGLFLFYQKLIVLAAVRLMTISAETSSDNIMDNAIPDTVL